MVHYKSKDHGSYPYSACGKNLMSMEHSDKIEEVTCKMCVASYHKPAPIIKGKGIARKW